MGKLAATDRPCLRSLSHSFTLDFSSSGRAFALREQEGQPVVEQVRRARGGERSPEQTRSTPIEDGVAFLGQNVWKDAGTLLSTPARKQVTAGLGKVRHIVQAPKQATAAHRIAQLTPRMRGWANYHRHVVSTQPFDPVATALCKVRWSWAKRRHPKKPRRWVADTSCRPRHGRTWPFVGTRMERQRQPYERTRVRAGDTPITRHVQVTGAAHPDAPPWEVSCEKR
jgi:RNA-directed DNA polymerase